MLKESLLTRPIMAPRALGQGGLGRGGGGSALLNGKPAPSCSQAQPIIARTLGGTSQPVEGPAAYERKERGPPLPECW